MAMKFLGEEHKVCNHNDEITERDSFPNRRKNQAHSFCCNNQEIEQEEYYPAMDVTQGSFGKYK
jgi:hypothetical protein